MAALELVAGGDLTTSVQVHTQDEVGRLAAALNMTVEKLRCTLQEVAESAAHSSSSSGELAAAADEIEVDLKEVGHEITVEMEAAGSDVITAVKATFNGAWDLVNDAGNLGEETGPLE